MKTMTHEEMLDKYIGKKGTAEREGFDAQVEAELQNEVASALLIRFNSSAAILEDSELTADC